MSLLYSILHSIRWFLTGSFSLLWEDRLAVLVAGVLVAAAYFYFQRTPLTLTPRLKNLILTAYGIYVGYFFINVTSPFFEGDAGNIIAGAAQMMAQVEKPILYNYSTQPFTYTALIFFSRLSGLDPAASSTLIAHLSLVMVLVLCYLAGRRLRSEAFALGLTGMNLLIHELLIDGCYYNSNIPAMACLYLAGYILIRTHSSTVWTAVAALLASCAFFFRVDIVLMLPALALIPVFQKKYRSVAVAAVTFAAVSACIIWLAQVKFSFVTGITKHHFGHLYNRTFPVLHTLLAAPLSVLIFSLIGFIDYIHKKNGRVIIFVPVSVLPLFLFYLYGNTTPKYLLYAYPVAAWLAVDGFLYVKNYPNRLSGAVINCALILLLVWQVVLAGLSFSLSDGWSNCLRRKTLLTVPTQDNSRALAGSALYPLLKFEDNALMEQRVSRVLRLEDNKNKVIWVGWNYYGIFNYFYTRQAVSISEETQHPHPKKTYRLPNGTEVMIVEFRFDSENADFEDELKSFYKQGYINIFVTYNLDFVKKAAGKNAANMNCFTFNDDPFLFVVKK